MLFYIGIAALNSEFNFFIAAVPSIDKCCFHRI